MAKYDNRFLMQYFKDIYALYILRDKVEEHIEKVESEISQLEEGKYYNPCPEQPQVKELGGGGLFGCATPFAILALFPLYGLVNMKNFKENGGFLLSILFAVCLVFVVAFVWAAVNQRKENQESNEAARIAYQQAVDEYRALEKENELCKKEIPLLQKRIARDRKEILKIEDLIQRAYYINIIPNRYRDFYTIVYLYDYFEGSREKDLAMALNLYVLEQIKDRLDRVNEKLSVIVLNQYTMIRNQERAAEEARHHHIDMKNRLQQIEASNEERNVYLEMIKNNTDTIRYFATVDFLSK